VETADADLDAALAQRPRQIERARELVDCTPASITMPAPASSIIAARRSGRMRVLISSKAWMSMSTSSPSKRRSAQSLARPYSAASEFDGTGERSHWMT